MPRITFIEADGSRHEVEALPGKSIMQAATRHRVPGILAECGGHAHCGTCHSYIDEAWLPRIPAPLPHEAGMIECVFHLRPNSRLACQIQMTPELDGIVVRLPPSQTSE